MAMCSAVFLLIITISSVFGDRNGVPVLIWGDRIQNLPPAYAGHTTSMKEFNENYVKEMVKPSHNVVTFLQDKLSVEDFTQMADVYHEDSTGGIMKNLKSLVEDHPSVHLPSVSKASAALDNLKQSFSGKTHQLASPYDMSKLNLKGKSANLIVVQLPSTLGSASEQLEAFRNIDKIIGSVIGYLKQQSLPFLAFYTAEKPSMVFMEEDNYMGRHLLAVAEERNATVVNNSCVMMYLEQFSLSVAVASPPDNKPDRAVLNLPRLDSSDKGLKVDCGEKYGSITMEYDQTTPEIVSNVTNLKLTIKLKSEKGFWQVSGSSLSYDVKVYLGNSLQPVQNDMKMNFNIFAPAKYSFHCSSLPPVYRVPANDSAKVKEEFITTLRFKELQLQYTNGNSTITRFGFANECEGFFSASIWMGLVCTLVLGLILAFGLCMLANINSMDRFDDPKGKTISVNVAD